jgi:ABC-type sugar transport system permease subunit
MVRITFPLLKTTTLSLVLLGIIGSLKTFELVYVLTQGGPNHASEMLPTFAFLEAFQLQNVGYASAISVVLLVIAVVSSLSMVRVFGAGFITGDEK